MHKNKKCDQNYENCPREMEIIKYLMRILSKVTLSSSNLDVLFGSQRSVLSRERLGYTSGRSIS